MADPKKFNAVAHFSRAVAGRRRASSTDQGMESIYASDPESAARMWFWRLSADERRVVDRVIIWAPKPHRIYSIYDGPTIVYKRVGGRLVEHERRNAP